ncbi:MAG: VOC family protein [Candidatus Nezhaarchaeota archaeon]|nr:VOC family protein [Candidatus Nezhaarchaeota archaeon]
MARVRLDHVAILVRDFEAALTRFKELLGVEDSEVIVVRGLENGEDLVDTAFLDLGGVRLEIFSPAKPGGAMEKALEKRGEGLHHVCFSTGSLDDEMRRLREKGVSLVDSKPRVDRFGVRYFYVHPKEAYRTLICFIDQWRPTGPHSWRPLRQPGL